MDKGDINAIAEWKQLGGNEISFSSAEKVAVRQIVALYGEESIRIVLVVHEPSKTKHNRRHQWAEVCSNYV